MSSDTSKNSAGKRTSSDYIWKDESEQIAIIAKDILAKFEFDFTDQAQRNNFTDRVLFKT